MCGTGKSLSRSGTQPGTQSGTQPLDLDLAAVRVMLGRPLRAESEVVSRCHLGLPVVIRVPPVLEDGTPFPTRYWLTCPLATRRISKLESSGLMVQMQDRMDVSGADAAYARDRTAALPEAGEESHKPRGGVGGAHGGIKCLHARYAYWRAGGADPAGAEAARRIGELDCTARCVRPSDAAPRISIERAEPGIGAVDLGRAM